MSHTEARAWWADVQPVRDAIERRRAGERSGTGESAPAVRPEEPHDDAWLVERVRTGRFDRRESQEEATFENVYDAEEQGTLENVYDAEEQGGFEDAEEQGTFEDFWVVDPVRTGRFDRHSAGSPPTDGESVASHAQPQISDAESHAGEAHSQAGEAQPTAGGEAAHDDEQTPVNARFVRAGTRGRRRGAPLELHDGEWAQPSRRGSAAPTERKTVQITGRPDPGPPVPRLVDVERRRPSRRPLERVGARPDRIAMWAVLLGFFLILVAATSSQAAPL